MKKKFKYDGKSRPTNDTYTKRWFEIFGKKEQEELLSDDENEYIHYQGVTYYYDREINVLANIEDYGEVGKWDSENQCIIWNEENDRENHMNHPDYSP